MIFIVPVWINPQYAAAPLFGVSHNCLIVSCLFQFLTFVTTEMVIYAFMGFSGAHFAFDFMKRLGRRSDFEAMFTWLHVLIVSPCDGGILLLAFVIPF